MQAIYEVQIEFDPEIAESYLEWLKTHMAELVATGTFQDARLYGVENEPCVRVVQYLAKSRNDIQKYLEQHAPRLRADGVNRFKDRFRIQRRILLFQDAVHDLTPS